MQPNLPGKDIGANDLTLVLADSVLSTHIFGRKVYRDVQGTVGNEHGEIIHDVFNDLISNGQDKSAGFGERDEQVRGTISPLAFAPPDQCFGADATLAFDLDDGLVMAMNSRLWTACSNAASGTACVARSAGPWSATRPQKLPRPAEDRVGAPETGQ